MSKKSLPSESLSLGSLVRIRSTGNRGEIIEGPDRRGRYLIAIGAIRIWSKADELEALKKAKSSRSKRQKRESVSGAAGGSSRCDLHGQSREQALESLESLESCLNQALLRGDQRIEVIHGIGKGILKQTALGYFENSPYAVTIKPDLHNPGSFWVYL